MNEHITDNILYYLSLDKPEYAILLTGKWGSGKTYFIDRFIQTQNEKVTEDDIQIQFIKISLFGLKDVSSIDEQIFQNLHPVLASKYARLTGNILKGAFKLGINLDLDGDGKKDGTLSTGLDKLNLLDFFSEKGKNTELVFVFDDLERTEIEVKEVLGYINYLVEQASFKAILIANEEKLLENDNNTYREFKEKVIGKTFEVRHDFDEVLEKFLLNSPINLDKFDKSVIINVYKLANYKNLRHIKQSIIDFVYVTQKISASYLDNIEFLSKFAHVFFSLSIEVKNGSLDKKSFPKDTYLLGNLIGNENKEQDPSKKILEKYNLGSDLILPQSTWLNILYKGYIETGELNQIIKSLSFFMEEQEKERPSWVKLWYYNDLEDDDYQKMLVDVIQKVENCSYETPVLLLHAVALLIYFYKEDVSQYSFDQIKKQVEKCLLDKYVESEYWKNNYLRNDIMYNGTGLGYMNNEDPDFLEIFKMVSEFNKKIFDLNVVDEEKQELENIIEAIKHNELDFVRAVLLEDKEYSPILAGLESEIFFNTIIQMSNKDLYVLTGIIDYRYSEKKLLNGRGYESYLRDELPFWQSLKEKFESFNYEGLTVKKMILLRFKDFVIDKVIAKLSPEKTPKA